MFHVLKCIFNNKNISQIFPNNKNICNLRKKCIKIPLCTLILNVSKTDMIGLLKINTVCYED